MRNFCCQRINFEAVVKKKKKWDSWHCVDFLKCLPEANSERTEPWTYKKGQWLELGFGFPYVLSPNWTLQGDLSSQPNSNQRNITDLTQEDGWKTQNGKVTKKCRARPGMHSLARYFIVMPPSGVFSAVLLCKVSTDANTTANPKVSNSWFLALTERDTYGNQGPVCRKSRRFSGEFRVTILFVSSKQRRLEAQNSQLF